MLDLGHHHHKHLRPLTTNSAREPDVLRHDGDPLRVDGAEVGVFEQADEVGSQAARGGGGGGGVNRWVGQGAAVHRKKKTRQTCRNNLVQPNNIARALRLEKKRGALFFNWGRIFKGVAVKIEEV